MADKIYVVAGSYREFITHLEFLADPRYVYVNSVRDLQGKHGIKVLKIGTYFARGDWNILEREIKNAEVA